MAARTAAEHDAQAGRNRTFYRSLGGTQSTFPDWAVTALFYTSVHDVEAALRALGAPPSGDHTTRRRATRTHLGSAVAARLEQLEQMSRDARYECIRHTAQQVSGAEDLRDEIEHEISRLGLRPY